MMNMKEAIYSYSFSERISGNIYTVSILIRPMYLAATK